MHILRKTFSRPILFLILVFVLAHAAQTEAAPTGGTARALWSVGLPFDETTCGHPDCHYGSPVVADISGDAGLEIIAVTNSGHVVAVRNNGSVLWDVDIAPYFGMAPNTHEIHSSPAVADIDGDGHMEIAVGTGTLKPTVCTQGGVIVLSHTGGVEPGWPVLAHDNDIPPAGCRDTIFSSPALGDMDGDGDMEVAAAGFDKRVYVWHHNGTLMSGYPATSSLHYRFPTWGLQDTLADNTWSSPAMADLDGDGYSELIIATGEGNFDARYGGDSGGWTCPYALPAGWAAGYCGGSVYAFDRFGHIMPGFPFYALEAFSSSVAIADVDSDGDFEIFVGTGDFYHNSSPDHPTAGFRVFGLDHTGQPLPGWAGGRPVGGSTVLSPSVGDITGDATPEIVTIADDGRVYAWHPNGQPVSGFPMQPRDHTGGTGWRFNTPRGIVLADYDGDNKMEIFFTQAGVINIVDGNGTQLTGDNFPENSLPIFYAEGIMLNTPAVSDLDNDGNLELVASNSKLFAWNLPNAGSKADWPFFKQNAAGTRVLPVPPRLDVNPGHVRVATIVDENQPSIETSVVVRNGGSYGSVNWSASAPRGVTITPSSGNVGSVPQAVHISIDPKLVHDGLNKLDPITFSSTVEPAVSQNSSFTIPISVLVATHQVFLPSVVH